MALTTAFIIFWMVVLLSKVLHATVKHEIMYDNFNVIYHVHRKLSNERGENTEPLVSFRLDASTFSDAGRDKKKVI